MEATAGIIIFAASFVVCCSVFIASIAADQGLDLPSIDFAELFSFIPVKRKPVLCQKTKRWRDPKTNKFVKTPAFAR